ncbi:MAG: ABC transporter permease [Smithellaceae bacterium]|nr:ABC transporter permease [Smithellaceae bacterium]
MKLHHISFNNLRRRKGKMIFLILGLFVGVATVVSLLSITETMTRDVEDRLDRFGANIVMVPRSDNLSLSYGGITVGDVSYQTAEFDESRMKNIRQIENARNIGIIAPKVIGTTTIKNKKVLLVGMDFKSELALKTWWQLDGEPPSAANELIVGTDAAEALHVAVGDNLIIAERGFTVAAILQRTGASEDGVIMGDLHEIQEILHKRGKVSLVEVVAFCRGCPVSEIVLQIAEKFPDARVTALEQVVMSKMQSVEMFRSFSYGIAILVSAIGALLVFVTMMGAVNERTREIGIFRAIGFRQGHVMQIVLMEAFIIGLISGLLGFIGGSLITWAVVPLILKGGSGPVLNLGFGGISILLGVSLSLLASLYPARKASRLDPSEALRAL